MVNAFNFTTLLPTPGIVLPNVENADYGIIETRNCGCLLEQEGFTEHLQVRSFRKLTGKGMTLVGNDMVRILQEVLPVRIGGSPLDYQLVEEDDNGFTRLSLAINPTVKIVPNESAVIDAVLSSYGQYLPPVIWRQAGTLRVRRIEPIWTARSKLMPLHLDHRRPMQLPRYHARTATYLTRTAATYGHS